MGSTDILPVAIADPLHVDTIIADTKIKNHLNDDEEEDAQDWVETRQLIPSQGTSTSTTTTSSADSNVNSNNHNKDHIMNRRESTKDSPASSMASSPQHHRFLSFRGKQQQQQQEQQLPASTRHGGPKAGSASGTNNNNNIIASWIENMESYRISSSYWSRKFRIEPETPWIQGLASVWYEGRSCADAIRILGMQPPRYLWYMISGGICDIIQFIYNVLLYYRIHVNVSMAWAIGFVSVIPMRHISHRYLVFGDYVGGYYNSLARMYAGYSVTIIASTILNFAFSRHVANMPLLYAITMIMTGVANYFILRRFWNSGDSSGTTSTRTSSTTATTTAELASLSDAVV
jgi:putative flippase GtrA